MLGECLGVNKKCGMCIVVCVLWVGDGMVMYLGGCGGYVLDVANI